MKIVAVVPMKLNNTRLPQKNIRCFRKGKPLCQYILDTLLACKDIDEIYVYCSNSVIREYIPDGVKYMKRDEKFDSDTTKMNEVLMAFSNDVVADVYVMAHTTAPFVTVESIEKGISMVKNGLYDSAFSVKRMQDFIWKNGMPVNYDLTQIPRTQDLEPIYVETSGFYIYVRDVITRMKRRIGDKPFLVEVGEIESCDIDEYDDFLIADAIQYYLQSEKKYESEN